MNPGAGYALTEVVHCKSNGEYGVAAARRTCADLYLERTLALSKARTLIAVGGHAGQELRKLAGLRDTAPVVGPIDISGRQRMLAFIPHSNARIKRTFATLLDPTARENLRTWTQKPDESEPNSDPKTLLQGHIHSGSQKS
jgi:uracil-DNA glycosylase